MDTATLNRYFDKTRHGVTWLGRNYIWTCLVLIGNFVAGVMPAFILATSAATTTVSRGLTFTHTSVPVTLNWTYPQFLIAAATALLLTAGQFLAARLGWRALSRDTDRRNSQFMKVWSICAMSAGLICAFAMIFAELFSAHDFGISLPTPTTTYWITWCALSLLAPASLAAMTDRTPRTQDLRRCQTCGRNILDTTADTCPECRKAADVSR